MVAPVTSPWDLWVLRGFDPTANEDDVQNLVEARRRQNAWESRFFQRLLAGDSRPLRPGRSLLDQRPGMRRGLVLTMHLGPFQFVLEPFLAAGLDLHVLLNADAMRRLRPVAERLTAALNHRGQLWWHPAEDPGCVRGLLRSLRAGEPVLAFADGNQGRDGLRGTRERGVPYALPGRDIRVRTGLARLICRTGCPVHPVSVRWSDDGESVIWRPQPTQHWGRDDDPIVVTHRLYDWVFSEVQAAPAQWSYWPMLGETASCFVAAGNGREVPDGLRTDYRRAFAIALSRAPDTVRVVLEADLDVWPGEILADLTRDRFFDAAGLEREDLALWHDEPPTLAALVAARGRPWVTTHVLRLALLGLARLQGSGSSGDG